MVTFLVTITLTAPEITRSRSRTIVIPPDYDPPSRRELFARSLENVATELIENEGWVARLKEAALANDAKITRIEQLIEGENVPPSVKAAIVEVILTPPADAIAQWGDPENE